MLQIKGLLLSALAGGMIAWAGAGSATVLAQYTFDGGSAAPTVSAGGIGVTAADFNDWIGGTTSPGFSASPEAAFARTNATNTASPPTETLADALSSNNYLSFNLNYIGNAFSVSQIDYTHYVTGASGTYTSYLFTSATGFSSGNQLATIALNNVTTSGSIALDVSGISALQGLTSSLEVRIYLSDSTNSNGEVHFLDNITVSAVPEPASLVLLLTGGVFLMRRQRA